MIRGKSNTFMSDLLRNPIFLFGLLCLGMLGMKKLMGFLNFGTIGAQVATYSYEMVRGKDLKRILTVDDYPTVVRENSWTPPQNRNPMSGDGVKNTMNGPAAPGQAVAGKKGNVMTPAMAAAEKAKAQAAAKRKAQLKVDVIGSDPVKSTGGDSSPTHNDVVFHGSAPALVAAVPADAANEKDKDEEKKLTLNDWRALLTTSSRKNLDKLIAAKKGGSISLSDYYALVKELVMSHVEDRQQAGLYVLKADVSATAFEFIVINKGAAAANVQTALTSMLKTYEEPAQADEMARVLTTSKRPEVQMEAMKNLTVAITALKKQVSAQGEGRNPAVAAQAQRDLLLLVPSLRRMTTTGEELGGMAADLLGQIEALTQKA